MFVLVASYRIVVERSSVDAKVTRQGRRVMQVLNAADVVVTNGIGGSAAQFTCFQRNGSSAIDLICCSHQLLQHWKGTEVWEGEVRVAADHEMVVAMLEREVNRAT